MCEESPQVIASATRQQMADSHRFEKISNIVKQFKLSCGKTQTAFRTLVVKNTAFSARMQRFTENTFILIVVTGDEATRIQGGMVDLNADIARQRFKVLGDSGLGFARNL